MGTKPSTFISPPQRQLHNHQLGLCKLVGTKGPVACRQGQVQNQSQDRELNSGPIGLQPIALPLSYPDDDS